MYIIGSYKSHVSLFKRWGTIFRNLIFWKRTKVIIHSETTIVTGYLLCIYTEIYSEPWKHLGWSVLQIAKGFKLLTIFAKCFKLDVWQGSQYTSVMAILLSYVILSLSWYFWINAIYILEEVVVSLFYIYRKSYLIEIFLAFESVKKLQDIV